MRLKALPGIIAKLNAFAQKIDFGGKGKVRSAHKHNGADSTLGEGEITITPQKIRNFEVKISKNTTRLPNLDTNRSLPTSCSRRKLQYTRK